MKQNSRNHSILLNNLKFLIFVTTDMLTLYVPSLLIIEASVLLVVQTQTGHRLTGYLSRHTSSVNSMT